ncbi:hypothetical protein [Cryptosporangium sp. NPDC051539]|uniref:hypothetical protein n=1 Tax=Cryptosporangium sp. NPDC051539 TaxID=3363962 RepID=UPI0037896FD1
MADILHRVGVVALLDDVYRAIATTDGLAGWWTRDTTTEDGRLILQFGDVGGFDLTVKELDPSGTVRWVGRGRPAPDDAQISDWH